MFLSVAPLVRAPLPENSGILKRLGAATAPLLSPLPAAHWVCSAVSLTLGDKACNVRSQHNTTVSRYSLSLFQHTWLAQFRPAERTVVLPGRQNPFVFFLFCFFLARNLQSAAQRLAVFPHVQSGHSLQQTFQANRLQGDSSSSGWGYTRRSGEDAETGKIFYFLFFKLRFSDAAKLGPVQQSRLKARFPVPGHI